MKSRVEDKKNLIFLANANYYYSYGKKIRLYRILISMLFPIVSFIITFFSITFEKSAISIVSILWILVSYLIFEFYEKKQYKIGAFFSEKFDTNLFNIPWNNFLIQDNLTTKKENLNVDKFKDWYTLEGETRKDIIINCQLQNFIWDADMRDIYAWTVTILLITFFFVLVFLANYLKLDFLHVFLLPSVPIFIHGINTIISNIKVAHKKLGIKKRKALISSEEDIRQFQDILLYSRINDIPIPNSFQFFYSKIQNSGKVT